MAVEIAIRKEDNWEFLGEHAGHDMRLDDEGEYLDMYCTDCGQSLAEFRHGAGSSVKPKAPVQDEQPCERCDAPERAVNSTYCAACLQAMVPGKAKSRRRAA